MPPGVIFFEALQTSPKALNNANTSVHKSNKKPQQKRHKHACCLQELLTGNVLSPGGSLTSQQLQRMVTALDLASDKGAEISALETDLVQAKSKALLYEVHSPSHNHMGLAAALHGLHVDCRTSKQLQQTSIEKKRKGNKTNDVAFLRDTKRKSILLYFGDTPWTWLWVRVQQSVCLRLNWSRLRARLCCMRCLHRSLKQDCTKSSCTPWPHLWIWLQTRC